MVEFERSEIACVPAPNAFATHQGNKSRFVAAAPFVLFGVALMMIAGVAVLTCA
jgi:hypothetical protein